MQLRPFAPLVTLAGEALFVLPWIWLPMMAVFVVALRRGPGEWRPWLLCCLAAPPIVAFAAVSAWSSQRVLFHWAAPGYLMLFPLLGDGGRAAAGSAGRAPPAGRHRGLRGSRRGGGRDPGAVRLAATRSSPLSRARIPTSTRWTGLRCATSLRRAICCGPARSSACPTGAMPGRSPMHSVPT